MKMKRHPIILTATELIRQLERVFLFLRSFGDKMKILAGKSNSRKIDRLICLFFLSFCISLTIRFSFLITEIFSLVVSYNNCNLENTKYFEIKNENSKTKNFI